MSVQRRSKTMPTEGHTTRFLYTILKQLDLKTIDWSLVATELEISNGHAARMRYSRFKQQMEGTATVSKTVKPKKSNAKSDSGKITKHPAKGKGTYEKNKNSCNPSSSKTNNNGKGCGTNTDGNNKKRSAFDDFTANETKRKFSVIPSIETEQMGDFSSSMLNPFANTMPFCPPSNGTTLTADPTYPYMAMPTEPQLLLQQTFDPHFNFYPAPTADDNMMFDQGFLPQNFDQSQPFSNDSLDLAAPDPSDWNQTDVCFSGCCQPQYPEAPALFQDYPTHRSESALLSTHPEPWVQENPLQAQVQNRWVPVKSEPGDASTADDIFVKVESNT